MATQTSPIVATAPPADAKSEWLAERKQFIGGSEAFELLNERQYGRGCHTALAFRKLGAEPDYPEQMPDEAILERGNILEPVVAALYEAETGRKLRRAPSDENGMPRARRSPQYPWAGVHVDRSILSGAGGVEETGDLEIKTRDKGPFIRVLAQGPFPGDLLQPQWANFVTGHRWSALAVLGVFGGLPLKHYDSKRDDAAIEIFKSTGDRFANQVWGKGSVPSPTFPADDPRCKVCAFRLTCRGEELDPGAVAQQKAARAAEKDGLVQIADAALTQALAERQLLKAELVALEQKLEQADELLIPELQKLGSADKARTLVSGFGKAYVMASQFNGLDQKKLKAEEPEIYQKYYVTRETGEFHLRTWPTRGT